MKYHLIRWGGLGDQLFVEPVIRYLKKQGHTIVYSTTERGRMMLANNPNIDEVIFTPDATVKDVRAYWDEEIRRVGADRVVNWSESIEVALLKHPLDPKYNAPKFERVKECDINAFDQSFKWAGINPEEVSEEEKRPQMYFTEEEEREVEKFFEPYSGGGWMIEPKRKMVIMWAMSGSALHKAYPYAMTVMRSLLEKYDNLYFLTVGDEACKLLEPDRCTFKEANRIIDCSGRWNVRKTMLAIKHCQMVIAPETGVLVGSGMYDTPKIGLLSCVTKNHVTKYFKNDYSIEAQGVGCSPCFRLVYNSFQCPTVASGAALCMAKGIHPQTVVDRVEKVITDHYEGFRSNTRRKVNLDLSRMQ
jgi:ADP-heptose:LPS heptosyltransferase